MLRIRYVFLSLVIVLLFIQPAEILAQYEPSKAKPHVIGVGVNGMEWDIIRPLLIRGELPNLAGLIKRGSYGKLRTLSSPNCPTEISFPSWDRLSHIV